MNIKVIFLFGAIIISALPFINGIIIDESVGGCCGKCTGSANCTACSNCSRCAHCSSGGTCGACKSYNTPPKNNYSKSSSKSNSYSDSKIKKGDYVISSEGTSIWDKPEGNGKKICTLQKGYKIVVIEVLISNWSKIEFINGGKTLTGYVFNTHIMH